MNSKCLSKAIKEARHDICEASTWTELMKSWWSFADCTPSYLMSSARHVGFCRMGLNLFLYPTLERFVYKQGSAIRSRKLGFWVHFLAVSHGQGSWMHMYRFNQIKVSAELKQPPSRRSCLLHTPVTFFLRLLQQVTCMKRSVRRPLQRKVSLIFRVIASYMLYPIHRRWHLRSWFGTTDWLEMLQSKI